MERAVEYILKNDTNVNALVGTQVYPLMTIQNIQAPFIIYSRNSTDPLMQKDTVSTLDEVQFDITIYHEKHYESILIAEAVRTALDRITGSVSLTNPTETVYFQSIRFITESSDFIENAKLFSISQSYIMRLIR